MSDIKDLYVRYYPRKGFKMRSFSGWQQLIIISLNILVLPVLEVKIGMKVCTGKLLYLIFKIWDFIIGFEFISSTDIKHVHLIYRVPIAVHS